MHRSKVGKKNIVKAKTVCGWLSKNTLPIMPSYYRLIAFTMGLDFFLKLNIDFLAAIIT